MIRADEAEIVVDGMESMTNAPHFLPKSREGFKSGDVVLVDSMAYDALLDEATTQALGGLTEQVYAEGIKPTREEQDAFAAASHQRAAKAWKNGIFDDEVVPATIPKRKGDPIVIATDEGVRGDMTAESLSKVSAAFAKDGTITAGSASQISDGACAVVVASKAKAEELGLQWLAEIGAHGMARALTRARSQPANATAKACEGGHRSTPRTSTSSSSTRRSRPSASSRPGRSALTSRRSTSTVVPSRSALELKRRGGGIGAAALCGGGGQGDSLIVDVP